MQVGAVVLLVMLPMLIPRSLAAVARFSGLSIIMVGCLASTIVGMSTLAALQASTQLWTGLVLRQPPHARACGLPVQYG